MQLLAAFTAFVELQESSFGLFRQASTFFGRFSSAFEELAVQLTMGISELGLFFNESDCSSIKQGSTFRFAGEVIGEGIGRTRREAHHQAAIESLMNLAACSGSSSEPTHACRALCGAATENANSDRDLEVVAENISVNLRCDMSGARMKIARRFKPCTHMDCFDLEVFVEMNQRSRKAMEDLTEIEVKPDGSWRVKPDGDYWKSLGDLRQWHLPNGTLCVPTDVESRPNPEALNKLPENFMNNGHKAIPMSNSATGSGRDDQPRLGLDGDADVIVLSDSDNKAENLISSGHIYKNNNPETGGVSCDRNMSVQEFPTNATMKDVLDRAGEGSYRWSPYRFLVKQEFIAKLNHEAVSDLIGKLRMRDVVELTPKIPEKSLIEKEKKYNICMYESRLSTKSTGRASGNKVGLRR
ncbi:E3 SUMO-protein ligase SIZ1 [Tanacetum coccineum]